MWVVIAIYVVGAIAGVLFTDAKPLMRIGFALAWPIGPLAFAVVVPGLVFSAGAVVPAVVVEQFAVVVGRGEAVMTRAAADAVGARTAVEVVVPATPV